MLFALRFTDRTDRPDLRHSLMEAHLAWLNQHRESVLVAGSLRQEPDDSPLGALWVVEAADRAAVEALFATDPFFVSGLRQTVEILCWSKAFEDRKVLV